ncbi:hypothetical protein DFH09DRAFT_1360584 [Mycena vulgaris]|nr:hypothetical protein DFH09DRAFT_1360584 [Mycena vulgaris]
MLVNCTVKTFHPRHLETHDFISAPRMSVLQLRLPTTKDEDPVHISLRRLGFATTIAEERVHGFLYYHLPYPTQFLSGGLRFRACAAPTPSAFAAGYDLLEPAGLPWTVPLAHLLARKRCEPAQRLLVRDGILTDAQSATARRMQAVAHTLDDWAPTFLHDLAQVFVMDFTRRAEVCVLGPHALVRTSIYPAVAHFGSALVRLERTTNDNELCARVLRPLGEFAYLPQFAHLPPVHAGVLLPDPVPMGHRRARTPRPWTWTYDDRYPPLAAALYCLLNPTQHFPPPPGLDLPPSDPSVGSDGVPLDADGTPLDVLSSSRGGDSK